MMLMSRGLVIENGGRLRYSDKDWSGEAVFLEGEGIRQVSYNPRDGDEIIYMMIRWRVRE
jgi:hypothetical protein